MKDIRTNDTCIINEISEREYEKIIKLNRNLDNPLSERAIAELKRKGQKLNVNRLYVTPKTKTDCCILVGNSGYYYVQTRNLKPVARKNRHPMTTMFVNL